MSCRKSLTTFMKSVKGSYVSDIKVRYLMAVKKSFEESKWPHGFCQKVWGSNMFIS